MNAGSTKVHGRHDGSAREGGGGGGGEAGEDGQVASLSRGIPIR